MTELRIGETDLSEYIWKDTDVHDRTLMHIDRAVVLLDPELKVGHGGPGDWSGIQWTFLVKKDGTPTSRNYESFSLGEDER